VTAAGTRATDPPSALPAPPSWGELGRRPVALFLDVDGTLVDFEARPEHVRATAGLVAMLREVAARLDGALALISGRPLADLDRIFAPWLPCAAGVHGVEVRGPQGTREHRPDGTALRRLREGAEAVAAQHPGVWVEDKGVGVALHYRQSPAAAQDVLAAAEALQRSTAPHFSVQPGHLVAELRPAGWDKGSAVQELLTQAPFGGRLPVVVGDDLTDEHAFATAGAHDGFGVLVGTRTDTAARYRLPDPAAVRGWLAGLLEEGGA
jgi:trehalose 6-phosphate phosphatase